MNRRLLIALALSAAWTAGCQTVDTTQAGTVGVQRHQAMLVSSEQMNQSAEKAYRDVLAQARKQGALDTNAVQVERIRVIAKRLIPQTAAFRTDATAWSWETHVITSKEVNAWCMPGGKIAVYTGLIEQLRATDGELAAVMGHEIAHALREHGRERASQAMAQGIAISVIGAVAGLPAGAGDLSQTVLDLTFNLPNSRLHEQEADRIGVELAARAGYDPREAVLLWEKMGKLGGAQPPQILSTHPSNEARIKDLREYAAKVLPLYEQTARR